jgi:LuxR family maltose regulon positive regulatory protein
MWREDWQAAIEILEPLLPTYARFRVPPVYCDPRIGLAYCQLSLGRTALALQAFMPVLDEALRHRTVGNLLLDSRTNVIALLNALPHEVATQRAMIELRRKLEQWWTEETPRTAAASPVTTAGGNRLDVLSERELEVLRQVATGASNKHIARALDLSLHTVKRHLCNILDKLDCDSRGQAADLFRRHSATTH